MLHSCGLLSEEVAFKLKLKGGWQPGLLGRPEGVHVRGVRARSQVIAPAPPRTLLSWEFATKSTAATDLNVKIASPSAYGVGLLSNLVVFFFPFCFFLNLLIY